MYIYNQAKYGHIHIHSKVNKLIISRSANSYAQIRLTSYTHVLLFATREGGAPEPEAFVGTPYLAHNWPYARLPNADSPNEHGRRPRNR